MKTPVWIPDYSDTGLIGEGGFKTPKNVSLGIREEVHSCDNVAVAIGLYVLRFSCARRIGLGKRPGQGEQDSKE